MQRFFGGPPLAVLGRLVLLSILLGVILTAIGPRSLEHHRVGECLITHLWNMGFDAVRWLWRYFLLGAVIVVPIWLLVRLAKAPRGLVTPLFPGAAAAFARAGRATKADAPLKRGAPETLDQQRLLVGLRTRRRGVIIARGRMVRRMVARTATAMPAAAAVQREAVRRTVIAITRWGR